MVKNVRVESANPRLTGLPPSINPLKPPKNYKDALPRADAKELKQAYQDMALVEAQLCILDFELASSAPSANDSS